MSYESRPETLEKLYRIKEAIKNAPFPPNYENDFDIYNIGEITWEGKDSETEDGKGFNCYAYAMQFCIPIYNKNHFWYIPGFLSGTNNERPYTKDLLVKCFCSDCEFLDLVCEETTVDREIERNAYKVAIMLNLNFSDKRFHFIRQNDDLTWSEKLGWNGEVGLSEDPNHKKDYSPLKIFKISKRI